MGASERAQTSSSSKTSSSISSSSSEKKKKKNTSTKSKKAKTDKKSKKEKKEKKEKNEKSDMSLEALKKLHADEVTKARQAETAAKAEKKLAVVVQEKLETPCASLRAIIDELSPYLPDFSKQEAITTVQRGEAIVAMATKARSHPETYKLAKLGIHAAKDVMSVAKQMTKSEQLLNQLGKMLKKP